METSALASGTAPLLQFAAVSHFPSPAEPVQRTVPRAKQDAVALGIRIVTMAITTAVRLIENLEIALKASSPDCRRP